MFSLIPKDQNFFGLFEQAAVNVQKGSMELLELLEKFSDVDERAKRIKDIEHAGDQLTHETIERLNRTFITPFDREDIHELASRLDDVIDLMDTATNRIVLYKIPKPTEDAILLGRCLRHSATLIVEAMPLMRDMKNSNAGPSTSRRTRRT